MTKLGKKLKAALWLAFVMMLPFPSVAIGVGVTAVFNPNNPVLAIALISVLVFLIVLMLISKPLDAAMRRVAARQRR